MAASSRYRLPDEAEMDRLLEEKDSKNTKRVVSNAVESFRSFLSSIEESQDFETYDVASFDRRLSEFFTSVQKCDGKPLKRSSMHTLRYGLKKYISERMNIDVAGNEFTKSVTLFRAVVTDLKKKGFGKVDHHPAIAEQDLKSLYSGITPVFYIGSPCGLQNKVWFELMFYLCRRGRENLRQMTTETFKVEQDDTGKRYVYQVSDELDKNHRENSTSSVTEGRMYEILGDRNCPVLSFQLYISKLNHNCDALWQKPKNSVSASDTIWYCNSPLGKNSLSKMMSNISDVGKLSQSYTNHSVRATSITVMDQSGIDTRHIMKVSGHASETSLKSYSHFINDSKKREISTALSKSLVCEVVNATEEKENMEILQEASPQPQQNISEVIDSDLFEILSEPFEIESLTKAPVPENSAPVTDVNNHNGSGSGSVNFMPKFDAGCNITINFNYNYK